MYKLSSLFSSRPSWLESFYEILASSGQTGVLMPDTIVMQYHKMSAAFASSRELSVQKTDLVRGGRVTTKVRALCVHWQRDAARLRNAMCSRGCNAAVRAGSDARAGVVRYWEGEHDVGVEWELFA